MSFDTRKLIVSFAKKNVEVPSLQFIRDDPEGIEYKLVEGNGIVNYLFIVRSADGKASVAMKYAEDSMRLMPEEKVSLERQDLEYRCLQLMNRIQPGSVPQPHCLDKQLNIFAMADMSDWELLATQIERRCVDMAAAHNLGYLLGKVHKSTNKENVTEKEWTDLQANFEQLEMKEYLREAYFDRPMVESDPINKVPQALKECHQKYITAMTSGGLQKKLNKIFNSQICFIHADCHFKSIFVKEGHISLFDFEFAFLGHPAFNLAYPIACYLRCYVLAEAHATPEQLIKGCSVDEYKDLCIQAVSYLVEGYLEAKGDCTRDEVLLSSFLKEVALFTGALLTAVSIFAAITNIADYSDEDRCCIFKNGFNLLKNHGSVSTADEFRKAMLKEH